MAQLKDLVVSGDARVSGNLYHNNPSYGYGTCTTAADVATKVVNTNDPTWTLTPGSVIVVKNTYTNTALNPTLNVNDTGDKSIWYDDFVITTSYLSMGGSASRPCMYVYDGTYYVWMAWSVDTDFAGTLATVATTGSYNDLSNKPTIPNQLSQLNDDATHRVVTDTEKSTWNAKSDFSGSYNDLTDKPTIPTVNNATLTIQKNGSNVGTFTANQSTDKTINITVPTDYIDTAGTGLSKSGSTLSLASGVVTAGTKGPTADVTGNDGNTIKVPKVTVDTYGRVTGLAEYTYTSKNTTYSAASGGGLSLSSNAFSLANSGVTAGSYGPSANASPGYSGTFSVPYITVDAKGRVTAASTKTITIPASDNTWRPVQNNLTSTSTSDCLSAYQGKVLKDGMPVMGSNSNGYYIKFPNLKYQICWQILPSDQVTLSAGTVGTAKTFTFPSAFSSTTGLIVSTVLASGSSSATVGYIQHSPWSVTTTTFQWRYFSKDTGSRTPGIGYIAIGPYS